MRGVHRTWYRDDPARPRTFWSRRCHIGIDAAQQEIVSELHATGVAVVNEEAATRTDINNQLTGARADLNSQAAAARADFDKQAALFLAEIKSLKIHLIPW